MKRRPSKTSTAFLDVLFNILLGFFILLVLAVALVNPPTKKADIELKAEYLITMQWPDRSIDDVDIFLKDPNGNVVYFRNKEIPMVNLDRDDTGLRSDTIRSPSGKVTEVYQNYEHLTIRKLLDGTYTVNVFMFQKRERGPTPVTVKLEQLNPYRVLHVSQMDLILHKDEATAFVFEGSNGKIVDLNTTFTPLVFSTGSAD